MWLYAKSSILYWWISIFSAIYWIQGNKLFIIALTTAHNSEYLPLCGVLCRYVWPCGVTWGRGVFTSYCRVLNTPLLWVGCYFMPVELAGKVYAVKKTAFRWREVLIMPKLKHQHPSSDGYVCGHTHSRVPKEEVHVPVLPPDEEWVVETIMTVYADWPSLCCAGINYCPLQSGHGVHSTRENARCSCPKRRRKWTCAGSDNPGEDKTEVSPLAILATVCYLSLL